MKRPNILLITTDQQRFDTIAALGNHEIYTPHLNWLCDEGLAFTRCYADCPVCMPSRATIMTGKSGMNHGLIGNHNDHLPMRDNPTFPALLTQNGYQTRAEGKLHFHPMRTTYGLEHADLPMDYFNEQRRYSKASTRTHGLGENEMEPIINTLPESESLTHWIVDKSMDFLENRDTTRPFFLWTSFTKPHPPLDPCLSYWELYRDAPLTPPVTGDWSKRLHSSYLGYYRPTFQLNNIWRMSDAQKLQIKRAYYACITQIDYNLGLLFARMRELELLENTWIIFTSDHGDMLGDHQMGAKSTFFEGSSHIPLLIKPPAKFGESNSDLAGLRCDKLVTLADIMPTILSLCSIEQETDGINLLEYRNSLHEQTFFGNCDDCYFAVIKGQYKYLWTIYGGQELLFDLKTDPYEQKNLMSFPEYESIYREMTQLLNQKMTLPKLEPCFQSHENIPRFPGLNTTIFPRDSFH